MTRSTSHRLTFDLPINNTVKLTTALRRRVLLAMTLEGFSVWSEFCRVALTEKCRSIEEKLKISDPTKFDRLYGLLKP